MAHQERQGHVPPRFNPPPGWPAPPPGWTPPPGWQPDPAWPAPPPGWQLWVEEPSAYQAPQASQAAQAAQAPQTSGVPRTAERSLAMADARWTLGGAAAIFLGSFLPWISASNTGLVTIEINGGAKTTSAIFGVALAALGGAIYAKSARGAFVKPRAYAYAIPLLVLSALGAAGYGIFTIAGFSGLQESDQLGDTAKVTFTPSVGLILLLLGCVAVLAGSIRVLRHTTRQSVSAPDAVGWQR